MRLNEIALLLIGSVAVSSCSYLEPPPRPTAIEINDSYDQQVMEGPVNPEWEVTNLPITDARIATVSSEAIIVSGTDGFAEVVGGSVVRSFRWPSRLAGFTSIDGGLSLLQTKDQKGSGKIKPESVDGAGICSPENVEILDRKIYILTTCEHTGQFLTFDLNDQRSGTATLLSFTYSTFPHSNADDVVFGPSQIIRVGGKLLFPATLKEGPALLSWSEKTRRFYPVWNGDHRTGVILSVDFSDDRGTMLTSNGKLFASEDFGRTWKVFSQIPEDFTGRVWLLRFKNLREGYVIGKDGIILKTTDGGMNWRQQKSNSTGSLYKLSFEKNRAVVLADFQTLFISEDGEEWVPLDFGFGERIDDVQLHNTNIFVLSGSRLFFKQVSLG